MLSLIDSDQITTFIHASKTSKEKNIKHLLSPYINLCLVQPAGNVVRNRCSYLKIVRGEAAKLNNLIPMSSTIWS
jgi:ribosomal protein L19